MSDLDIFRQDFSGILSQCAKAREVSLCGALSSGDDLKIIALFERLARDAETLDAAVLAHYSIAEQGLGARWFVLRREALLAQVGILYWPTDAADLIRWMVTQASLDLAEEPSLSPNSSMLPPARRRRSRGSSASTHKPQGLGRAWAIEFSAGLGIVAPLLSLWHVRAGIGQMQDRAFMAEHPSVPATVISVDPSGGVRSSGSADMVVLDFRQPSGEACRVTWHSNLPFTGTPGDILAVVPRSSACGLPLIPLQVGDPPQSFALAAALMAAGLISLRLWAWFSRHLPQRTNRPKPYSARSRRHDLA
ncbi:hypothetical protein [Lichenihabitans psoromatis]|uniref:hypothetical protein n=1 Tax=Lichenihabitans psoromatis TaxID=2528642 RepID=UPI0010365329|nr:hypothetical protein [Lichenihabitans psoromatis]